MAAQKYDVFFGSSNTGATPTFSTFVNDSTNVAITPPAVTELGGGFYRFQIDWGTIGATVIRYALGPVNGVEVSDTLTSNPAPGTVTPAVRPQNLALYPTAATVLSRAATKLGLTPQADPFGATDPSWVLLRDCLISLSARLYQEDWTNLIQPYSFVTDGVTQSYTLPSDFHELVDDTIWNRTTRLPGAGPLSRQQSAALQARLAQVVLFYTYQVVGGVLYSPIVPPAGATIAGLYISSNWVQSASSGTPDKDRPTANDDVLLFDEELLVLGLALFYDDERGFDTAKRQEKFDAMLEHALGVNDPGPVLSFGARPRTFDRPINGWNLPEGNW